MVQNDLGNGLSYIVILLGLLWIGNVKFSHALIGLSLVAGIAFGGAQAYIHYHDEIKESKIMESRGHWMERIDPWLVPEKATAKASYHTNNAKLAIASGGMSGEGYLQELRTILTCALYVFGFDFCANCRGIWLHRFFRSVVVIFHTHSQDNFDIIGKSGQSRSVSNHRYCCHVCCIKSLRISACLLD